MSWSWEVTIKSERDFMTYTESVFDNKEFIKEFRKLCRKYKVQYRKKRRKRINKP